MKYVTGVYGLNIENSKETCGDWHSSALDWDKVTFLESEGSLWGEWGIEANKPIPEHDGLFYVADDMRSILDLIGVFGRLSFLKGFRNDFFCTDIYNQEFFEKVYMLKDNENWSDISKLMKGEFMQEWSDFLFEKGDNFSMSKINNISDWRNRHFKIMKLFVTYINNKTDKFILKGGTSLLMCYNLDRFSEDLDFDGFDKRFFDFIEDFKRTLEKSGISISYRKGKDTDTVKRAFIHYGGKKPLKIEVSYRRKSVPSSEVTRINGIVVYSINSILSMKINAFNHRDKIRDLYDIVFIYKNYRSFIRNDILYLLSDAIGYKGIEQFDFLIKDQEDELINNDKLLEDFLSMYYSLGLN